PRVLVLHLAGIGGIGALHPWIALGQDRREPGKEKVAQLAVVYEVEVRWIRDHRINRGCGHRQLRAVPVENHQGTAGVL
ncbi:MAG: hypothetical protein ACK56F_15810, partial [bacterium]